MEGIILYLCQINNADNFMFPESLGNERRVSLRESNESLHLYRMTMENSEDAVRGRDTSKLYSILLRITSPSVSEPFVSETKEAKTQHITAEIFPRRNSKAVCSVCRRGQSTDNTRLATGNCRWPSDWFCALPPNADGWMLRYSLRKRCGFRTSIGGGGAESYTKNNGSQRWTSASITSVII